MDDKKIDALDVLFNICINLNDHLLKIESSHPDEISLIDHYTFQLISYAVSLIHNDLTVRKISLDNVFIMRSMIECLAIINMHREKDIQKEANILIKEYNYLKEFYIYKKYKNKLDGKIFDFNQIKENYESAKKKYKTIMDDKSSKEFNQIIKSKLPFLEQDYSFDELIQCYCSEYYPFYKLLSVCIHPNDYNLTESILETEDLESLKNNLYLKTIDFISEYYNNENFSLNKNLKQEMTFVLGNPINHIYLSYAANQKKSLLKISELLEKEFGCNTASAAYRQLGLGIEKHCDR